MEKLNKKYIVIATYFRKCVPFITLGKEIHLSAMIIQIIPPKVMI